MIGLYFGIHTSFHSARNLPCDIVNGHWTVSEAFAILQTTWRPDGGNIGAVPVLFQGSPY